MVFTNTLLYTTVALGFLGSSIATTTTPAPAPTGTYSGTYTSLQGYTSDLSPCINNCYSEFWLFAKIACSGGADIKCVCLIPEPDTSDPELGALVSQVAACTTLCPVADLQGLVVASQKLDDTCAPYISKYGPVSTASHSYFDSILSTAGYAPTATGTGVYGSSSSSSSTKKPYPTTVVAPIYNTTIATSHTSLPMYTSSSSVVVPAGNYTPTSSTLSTGTTTTTGTSTLSATISGVVTATANAASWSRGMDWQSMGFPLLVSFVLGVGAQLM